MNLPCDPELTAQELERTICRTAWIELPTRSERKTDFDQPTSSTITCRLCSPLIASLKGAGQNGSTGSFDVFLAGPFRKVGASFNQTTSPCAILGYTLSYCELNVSLALTLSGWKLSYCGFLHIRSE